MAFDFYEIYKDSPTTELLKVVHSPDGFLPEAVKAARRRLSEREVAPEDQAAVQAFYDDKDRHARLKAEKIDRLKEQAADLLQPIVRPGPAITPRKWLNLFLLIIGLQYTWTLIQTVIAVYRSVVRVVVGAGFGVHEQTGYKMAISNLLDFSFLMNIVTLLYLPLFFYLLYKRKRWGWILVFAELLMGILAMPIQVYSYSIFLRAMRVEYMPLSAMGWFGIQTLLKIAFAWFLWRLDVCELFGVDKAIKTRTVIYTSVIALLGFGTLWLLY
jgi:hypothetical protein